MSGLYIVADLGALRAAADHVAGAAGDGEGDGAPPSFGSPDADAAMSEFAGATRDHGAAMADSARKAAGVLHGWALTFHEIGD